MARPSKGMSDRNRTLSRRRSAKSAPCTMPKSDWGDSPRASRLRAAQRCVRSRAARTVARSATALTHWSSTIMMSLPMATWVAMESSGLSRTVLPST